MSIPRWRHVKSTDDGCDIFQCLSCYESWESRTTPDGYRGWQGMTHCPYCGLKWEGEQQAPPKRWEEKDKYADLYGAIYQMTHWPPFSKPEYAVYGFWVVEGRNVYVAGREADEWMVRDFIPVGSVQTWVVLAYLRHSRRTERKVIFAYDEYRLRFMSREDVLASKESMGFGGNLRNFIHNMTHNMIHTTGRSLTDQEVRDHLLGYNVLGKGQQDDDGNTDTPGQ